MTPSNPFHPTADPDRHYIWQRLIVADTDAFASADFAAIEGDFDAANFEGIRCGNSSDPDRWSIAFATLAAYRDAWLAAAREFAGKRFAGMSNREALYARARLERIDLAGDRALCHKKFSGELSLIDGSTHGGSRQTLYRLHRQGGAWKIVGFLGMLPLSPSQQEAAR